jgi:hypothetical protein
MGLYRVAATEVGASGDDAARRATHPSEMMAVAVIAVVAAFALRSLMVANLVMGRAIRRYVMGG